MVRFATAGDPCQSRSTVYIDSEDGANLFCGEDVNNYTGPLFPSEIDEATLGTPGFQVHWASDADREQWERAVEAAFERIAGPRLAKRDACAGDIGQVELTLAPPPEDLVVARLAPAPGMVSLTWGIDWLQRTGGVAVDGGLSEAEAAAVLLQVPAEGSASTSYRFVLRDGGRFRYLDGRVWINAETDCGAIDSINGMLAYPD